MNVELQVSETLPQNCTVSAFCILLMFDTIASISIVVKLSIKLAPPCEVNSEICLLSCLLVCFSKSIMWLQVKV